MPRTYPERTGHLLTCKRKATPGMPYDCLTEYYASPSRIAKGSDYCSLDCGAESRRAYKLCPQCNEMKVTGRDTFCSIQCAVANREGRLNPIREARRGEKEAKWEEILAT